MRGFLLPPATKLGQGNIFTGVCDSVHRGEGLSQCMMGYHPHPPLDQAGTPPDQAPPLDQAGTPQSRAYWEIWSMSGRYASYWNAILFMNVITYRQVVCCYLETEWSETRRAWGLYNHIQPWSHRWPSPWSKGTAVCMHINELVSNVIIQHLVSLSASVNGPLTYVPSCVFGSFASLLQVIVHRLVQFLQVTLQT